MGFLKKMFSVVLSVLLSLPLIFIGASIEFLVYLLAFGAVVSFKIVAFVVIAIPVIIRLFGLFFLFLSEGKSLTIFFKDTIVNELSHAVKIINRI